jgi:hypothetical protein
VSLRLAGDNPAQQPDPLSGRVGQANATGGRDPIEEYLAEATPEPSANGGFLEVSFLWRTAAWPIVHTATSSNAPLKCPDCPCFKRSSHLSDSIVLRQPEELVVRFRWAYWTPGKLTMEKAT